MTRAQLDSAAWRNRPAIPPIAPPKDSNSRRIIGILLASLAGALMLVAILTSYQVLTNLRDITSEASDNVVWSLAQVERETSDYIAALETTTLDTDDTLDRVRLRFDILYSRIATVTSAAPYRHLQAIPEYKAALDQVVANIQASLPYIDAPDAELRAALPELLPLAGALREDTRILSLSGLTFFAKQSDIKRDRVTQTLLRLAAITVLLVTALIGLVLHVLATNRRTRQHGHALAQANSRMNTILTASLDGVVVVDSDGLVLEFNKAAEDIFQYKLEDIRGQHILDLIAPPHMRETHAKAMRRAIAGEGGHVAGQGRVRLDAMRSDGSVFPAEFAIEVAEEDNQKIFLGFLHDISDRVSAEEELVQTRDRALAGEKAKADFLAVMSHEIRTPLNGILGNLSLLNDTALSSTQTRYTRNMEISGRVLMRHVDSVLDIARLEAGHMDVKVACTDLSVLLQELVDSQLSAANAQDTALSWRWEGTPRAWVRTDRAALEQVLLNLLGNAIKFTRNGTITIEAEALPETINGLPAVELRVTDTGLGIAGSRIDQIFDDFVTNDPAFGRVPGGTGLGLGIARRIVTAMGGEIGVESALGEGSVFWVRLPMEEGRQPPAPNKAPPPRDIRHLHMLVVEDNEINRELAKDMLQHEGHWVTLATDGADGVRQAAKTKFDMILMDIAMPVLDGLQATLAIRSTDGPNQHTPIVAVSANILPEERARLMASGMNDFLSKPLDRGNLRQLLHAMFGADVVGSSSPKGEATSESPTLPPATFARLLKRFLHEGDALCDVIATSDRDADDIAGRCHDLASAAAIFGAHDLNTLLSLADKAAKQNESADFEKHIAAIPDLWPQARAELAEQLPSDAAE